MLCKRIIPCLDVDKGQTVKGVRFTELRNVGDPVELAAMYQEQGADELVFLDITATRESRDTLVRVVEDVARVLMIPFTVGGGISRIEHVTQLLQSGADKVSINSAAVARPGLIREVADQCGSQCCVLAVDAKKNASGTGWEVLTHGGTRGTGKDALTWAIEAVALGAGEILLTSWDRDGTRLGYDVALTSAFATNLPVPVIASGGASDPESFVEVFEAGQADAALAAGIFHDRKWTVNALKACIAEKGIEVRLC